MLYPLVSVRRISHRSLNELPRIEDVAVNDVSKDVFALLDEDFTLATRTYQGTDLETVEDALFAAGFDVLHGTTPSQNGFSLECCGEYDAIWVHLFEVDSGCSSFSNDCGSIRLSPFVRNRLRRRRRCGYHR